MVKGLRPLAKCLRPLAKTAAGLGYGSHGRWLRERCRWRGLGPLNNHRTARPLCDFVILGIVKKIGVKNRTQCMNSVCRPSIQFSSVQSVQSFYVANIKLRAAPVKKRGPISPRPVRTEDAGKADGRGETRVTAAMPMEKKARHGRRQRPREPTGIEILTSYKSSSVLVVLTSFYLFYRTASLLSESHSRVANMTLRSCPNAYTSPSKQR